MYNNPGIIIQARLTSNRFPNKVLEEVLGKKVIDRIIEVCIKSNLPFVIAIPETPENDPLEEYLKNILSQKYQTNAWDRFNPLIFRGKEQDVLTRFIDVNKITKFDPIIRICADSPFLDLEDIKLGLELFMKRDKFVMLNHVQVFSQEALNRANEDDLRMESREHVVRTMFKTVEYPEDIRILDIRGPN